jgi:hypothetical protein
MKKLVSILLLSLSLAVFSASSHAAGDIVKSGPLHDVDLKNNRLVIDDKTRYLAPGYVVKNKKGEVVSAFALKRGQVIEYKINEDRKVTEIIINR